MNEALLLVAAMSCVMIKGAESRGEEGIGPRKDRRVAQAAGACLESRSLSTRWRRSATGHDHDCKLWREGIQGSFFFFFSPFAAAPVQLQLYGEIRNTSQVEKTPNALAPHKVVTTDCSSSRAHANSHKRKAKKSKRKRNQSQAHRNYPKLVISRDSTGLGRRGPLPCVRAAGMGSDALLSRPSPRAERSVTAGRDGMADACRVWFGTEYWSGTG